MTSERLPSWMQENTDDRPTWTMVRLPGPELKPASPEHRINPFTERLAPYSEGFQNLKLGGHILIPKKVSWVLTPPPGQLKDHTFSYEEIARKGKGWKLHLNFEAQDEQKVHAISECLTAMEELNMITTYKIGQGGGKASGQPGKEATVYVGHKDKTKLVAQVIEDLLGNTLDLPEGDALIDDVSFTPKVMGRFEIRKLDDEFLQYGVSGFPFIKKDAHALLEGSGKNHEEACGRATQLLEERYGAFYAGTSQVLPAWMF